MGSIAGSGRIKGHEDEIVAMYAEEKSLTSIARHFGLHTTSVTQLLDKLGLRERRRGQEVEQDKQVEIARRYAAKEPTAKLAEEFNISKSTVREIAKRHGCEVNPKGQQYRNFTPEEIAEMAARWQAGESQHKIGQSMGVAQVIVSRVLRQAGISTHRRTAKGETHGFWKGGRVKHPSGYWQISLSPEDPLHCMLSRQGYAQEHRVVMARALGRPLTEKETVHHINGDGFDNRLENLQLRYGRHGTGVILTCRCCGSHDIEATEIMED